MKIILAEDDTFFQNFYSKKLIEQGFQVEVAHDGVEAVEKVMAFRPDIMLLDLIMPRKDGFQVLTELRSVAELQSLPILVFSTLGQDTDIEKAKKLGATDYINKTFFDFDNLLSKIVSAAQK